MNATHVSSEANLGGFALIFGVIVAALSAIAIVLLAYYLCFLKPKSSAVGLSRDGEDGGFSSDEADSVSVHVGLDDVTLNTYPKLLYSQAKLEKGDTIATCCSICLGEYKDHDLLRLLPDCDHIFHIQCIDPWLKRRASCPVCRNTSEASP
ncbi:hypothetical protein K2173_024107 [Erythroxylum novogranatense]|uniref:RING-type E3 ubiquitin transferase n=1 Tax=Erythroxylum novogranatense TaxID=1862640 RepID=A0AAV8UGR5_9ROSI|nr:hypothetical protein K2173_024107 [Erythroxylum novogranatense]